jgi:hypothetical protein
MMTLVAMSMSAALSAGVSFDNPEANSIKEEISNTGIADVVPVAAEVDGAAVKEWTIMVFVNGKNNLEQYALKDMNEMEMVGSSDKVNVVTEIGRIAGYDSSDGNWVGSRRYLVQKDNDTKKISSPVVQDLGKVDMGDYKHLADFANWAKTNYPAKRYMLIVWNHGAGWIKTPLLQVNPAIDTVSDLPKTRGISYDDETNHHITTPQLGLALASIGKIDVYGSDACLMQMPEVDYEIKDSVDYIVGSEETEPGDGYTYNTLLGPLLANPSMGAEELGKLAVNAYADHYQAASEGSTQSLVKVSALGGFIPLVNNFVAAAMASGEKALVTKARDDAQSYAYAENKDMSHFLALYMASTQNADVKAKAQSLQDYLLNTLVSHNRVSGSYDDSKGLAIYMPGSPNSAYNGLAWAKASQWDEFIGWYSAKE